MSRVRMIALVVAGTAGAVWVSSCGDGAVEPTPAPPAPVATTVTVNPGSAALSALGETARFTAEVRDQNGQVMAGAAVAWTSSDASVATVDASGLATSAANGIATITATAGSASGTAAVTVAQVVTAVVVSPAADTLLAFGDTVRLVAEATDANGHSVEAVTEFVWSSSDTLVARVDDSGLVTGVDAGMATITATTGDYSGTAEITTVENPERAALVALYEATGGPNWVNNENWLTDAPLGQWYGVETDTLGRVTGLDLAGEWDDEGYQPIPHGLAGGIPPELANLAELERLDLSLNELSGPIPPELGSLATLQELDLYDNQMSGPIPPELGNLTSLERLTLFDNRLSGPIPPELGNLSVLQQLNLAGNELSGPIPPELGNLTRLDQLALRYNRLTGAIPSALGSLVRLRDLTLEANQLTGPIPPELASLTRLYRLYLRWNQLSGSIPPGFVRMERLGRLYLGGNASLCRPGTSVFTTWLQGVERQDAGGLRACNEINNTTLGVLYQSTGGAGWTKSDGWLAGGTLDQWYGVVTDSLGRVTTLDLASNGLSGRLPPTLGLLDQMIELRIGGNDLSGRLPSSLVGLPMRELHYADTGLCAPTGVRFQEWLKSIPSYEGTGSACPPLSDREILVALYDATGGPDWKFNRNWLTDAPLEEWDGVRVDHLGRVVELEFPVYGMTGTIPAELGSLANLTMLNLWGNQLSGSIPPELGTLANLTTLDLCCNDLSGPIPPEFGDLANLTRVSLFQNKLTGPIPPELGRLANLNELLLNRNSLTGPIPPELGGLADLAALTLAVNQLSGPIPPELGGLANLEELSLTDNSLTGSIPPELGELAKLEELGLNVNSVTGPIPPELGNLSALEGLYLGDNELSGPIPSALGGLAKLTTLDLWGNQLSGPIPPDLGNLAALEQLFLDDNDLEGALPPELGNLSALELLFLQDNRLEGPIPSEFGDLAALELLSLEDNDLSGPVPSGIGGMASLREMGLTGNSGMAGALPAGMTALSRLDALLAGGTGLCAPTDAGFQAWLDGVYKRRIAPCSAGDPPMAYLTQAVQSREFPVPLVAGEKALLRVFPTASRSGGVGLPDVRARFYQNGRETHVADMRGSSVPIPTEVDESGLDKSVNAEVPGRVIQPGLEMVIEVDPEGTLDPSLGVAKRIPATGRLAVDVGAMPVFDLTMVPFIWTETGDESIVSLVREIAADPGTHELLADTRTLLPIHDIEATAHEPVLSSSNDGWDLFRKTTAIRAMEGGTGHYMGMMAWPRTGPSGIAKLPGRSSFAAAGSFVIAHELGHNLNLQHAPCGGAGGPDPSFPYSDGSIGAWGYDFRDGGRLVSPSATDLMAYCGDTWISDYSFTNALRFRLSDADSTGLPSPPMAAAPTKALLLWGGVDADTLPFLEPAFVVEAPPALPAARGDYRLSGRSADGRELFAVSFEMPTVADGGGEESSFAFLLPVQAGWADLVSITLSGPGGSVTMDQSTDRPMAILRDLRTGRVRGFLSGIPVASETAADAAGSALGQGMEVLFSRGIPDMGARRR